jgi:hypothetical protein
MHGDLTVSLDLDADLALRARVEALCAHYAHVIDDDRLEELPALFADDGVYRVQTRENHDLGLPLSLIYCDGAAMLADRVTAMRTANIFEPHVYCHSTSALRILRREGEGWWSGAISPSFAPCRMARACRSPAAGISITSSRSMAPCVSGSASPCLIRGASTPCS